MKVRKRILILAAVFLYGCAVHFCRAAKEDANCTYIMLSAPIEAAKAEDIFTREAALADSVGFCFWGEQKNRWVSCKETGGIAEVTAVLISGNPGLLDAEELFWQKGCFLDEATAQTLFGTADCREQTVWDHGKSYRVFDTIAAPQPTMLTVAEASHGLVLNRCVLHVPVETGKQTAQQFLLRWGLAGEVIDYYPLWVVVYDSLLILPVFLIFQIYLYGRSRTQSRGKRILLLLTAGCLLLFFGSRLRFLPDMFPSRWSDFSFWGKWWEGQRENLRLVLRASMGERHLQLMMNMVKSIGSSTGAMLLTLWNLRRQKHADTAD